MTIANYAKNFDSFSGEKFTVDPAAQVHGTDKVVMSKLVTGGQTIPFNYRMRQSGGTWKVIDVYLNGSSASLRPSARISVRHFRPAAHRR